ncbi:MAG: TSCPD domain-containing protein [Bacteroidales bacterium]|nr:TSCPD domain-containing protein [Bacteroidales bacterium]
MLIFINKICGFPHLILKNFNSFYALSAGQKIDEVIAKLDCIRCGNKITSCPDQLCKTLKELKRQ